MTHKLCIEKDENNAEIIQGYRIVQLQYVSEKVIHLQYLHSQKCTCGELKKIEWV